MSEGQYESDKAIYDALPSFTARPYKWGKYKIEKGEELQPQYFLLSQFRDIGQQPPDPERLALRLAQLHRTSISPNGKFGFHTTTCHAKLHQLSDIWESSWETCFHKQLAHMFECDKDRMPPWSEFAAVGNLILEKCVPELLRPLQADGRNIKPCLVHGNIWDENTATDVETGEPFVFDGSAMYAHNEYELGNWRTPRHRLSSKAYIRNYKKHFPASEPGESKLVSAAQAVDFVCKDIHADIVCLPTVGGLPGKQSKIGILEICYIPSAITSMLLLLFLEAITEKSMCSPMKSALSGPSTTAWLTQDLEQSLRRYEGGMSSYLPKRIERSVESEHNSSESNV